MSLQKAVDARLRVAHQALVDAQTTVEVAAILSLVVDRVEEGDMQARLKALQSRVSKFRTLADGDKAKWRLREQELKKETCELLERIEGQKLQNSNHSTRSSEVDYAIEVVQHQENSDANLEKIRTKPQDLTRLPSHIIVSLMGLLSLSEAVTAFGVCHRWKRVLDHEALWRGMGQAQYQEYLAERSALRTTLAAQASAPRSLSVTINDIKAKKAKAKVNTLPKSLIFQLCLDHVHTQVNKAVEVKNDALEKMEAEQQVTTFLENKLTVTREGIGEARLETERWTHALEVMASMKDGIAKQIQAQEGRLRNDKEKRTTFVRSRRDSLMTLDNRMQLMNNVAENFADFDPDGGAPSAEQLEELKFQKKVLRKGVKVLRTELAQVQEQKEDFERKLAELQQNLGKLGL